MGHNNNNTQKLKEALSALVDDELQSADDITSAGVTDSEIIDHTIDNPDFMASWHSSHVVKAVLQGDYQSTLPVDFSQRIMDSIVREDASKVVSITQARDRITRKRSASQQSVTPNQTATRQPATRQLKVSVSQVGVSKRASVLDSKPLQNAKQLPTSNNQQDSQHPQSTQQPATSWKPIAGLGLAASLAGATILFAQLWQTELPTSPLQSAEGQQTQNSFTVVSTQPTITIPTNTNPTKPSVEQLTLQTVVHIGNQGTRWRMDTEEPRNQSIEDRLNILLTNHLEDASMGRVHGLVSHSRIVGYDSMPDKNNTEQSK